MFVVCIISSLFPEDLLRTIADETNRYRNQDWVRSVQRTDKDETDSNDDREDEETETISKRTRQVPCSKKDDGSRHCFQQAAGWIDVTPGFLLVYFGILCILGASGIRTVDLMWESSYGINIPFVQNACVSEGFLQVRRHIHFVDNSKIYGRNHPKWHPLVKILPIMNIIMKKLCEGWTLGERVCVDKSMIKYMGKIISFVQYMPNKPRMG